MREENEIQNWCEVLSSESGKILGAHIIGPHFAVSLTLRGSLSAVSTPILQVTTSTRWKAGDAIYKIHILSHHSDLEFLANSSNFSSKDNRSEQKVLRLGSSSQPSPFAAAGPSFRDRSTMNSFSFAAETRGYAEGWHDF